MNKDHIQKGRGTFKQFRKRLRKQRPELVKHWSLREWFNAWSKHYLDYEDMK